MRERLGFADEEELLARVAVLPVDEREHSPLFLPYLSGERTPHNDPNARGVLFGLRAEHDAAHIGYAVIEGVSFGLRDGWAAMQVAPGEVDSLSLVGGGARSALWAQLVADVLGVALVTHEGGEAGGALGAARLARPCSGGDVETVCVPPPLRRRFEPASASAPDLDRRYQRFRRLYAALADEFPRTTGRERNP